MSKPHVIAFMKENSGIGYHRLWSPLKNLERRGLITLDIWERWMLSRKSIALLKQAPQHERQGLHKRLIEDEKVLTDESLAKATHIIVSRLFALEPDQVKNLRKSCDKNNVKIIVDQDDWWNLPDWHPKKGVFIKNQMDIKSELAMEVADEVWVASKYLSKKIRKHNRNITIVPNAIDTHQEPWQNHSKPERPVTFGYIAGNFHEIDIQHKCIDLSGVPSKVVSLGLYAEMMKCKDTFAPVHPKEYGVLYKQIDVSLVPLESHEFHKCKSHLKLIEAGFTNTAVIVSPVVPYAEHLRPGKNCLTAQTATEWSDAINKLKNNRALVTDLAAQLSLDMAQYNMDEINNIRLASL